MTVTGNRKRKSQQDDNANVDGEELKRKRAMSRKSSAKYRGKERYEMQANLAAKERLQKNNGLLKKENEAIRAKIAAVKKFKSLKDQRLLTGLSVGGRTAAAAPPVAPVAAHPGLSPPAPAAAALAASSAFFSRTTSHGHGHSTNTTNPLLLSNRPAVSGNLLESVLFRLWAAEQSGPAPRSSHHLQDYLQLLSGPATTSPGQPSSLSTTTTASPHHRLFPSQTNVASSRLALPQHYHQHHHQPSTTNTSHYHQAGGLGTHNPALSQLLLLQKARLAQQQQQYPASSMTGIL